MTAVASARSLAGICQATRTIGCGHCGQIPGLSCTSGGLHIARFARAYTDGLISKAEFGAVLHVAEVFTNDTVVHERGERP